MTRDRSTYHRAYYVANRDAILARSRARYTPVPPDRDRRRKARLNTGLATGSLPEQVRHLFGRDFKRHQIATLLGISRARVTQILNGRRGEPGALPPNK